MPRYEFSEGSSNKFWEIKLSGSSFTTTYGKIGTDGQSTLKEFSSPALAQKEHDKLVAEKTKKGYTLAGGGGGAKAAAKPSAAPAAKPAAKPAKASKPAKSDDDEDGDDDEAPATTSARVTPGARYFEFVEGTSNKFWEIKQDGESVMTRYGKIGTDGQTTLKELDSRADAFKEYQKLVAEKTKKGYREKSAGGGASADKRNPALEKAIFADPYDFDAYMVYADWLQGEGDPRGELMSLQLTAESKKDAKLAKAATALLEKHTDRFLGSLAEHTKTYDGNDKDAFTWRFGHIHAARLSHNQYTNEDFEGSIAEILDALLRHPSGRFLTELTLTFNNDPNESSLDDVFAVLAKNAPASLRKLHVGDFEYPDETEMSWYHVGNIGKIWKAVPKLQHLIVQGGEFDLGTIELPALKHAEFRTGGLSKASGKAIAKATWPAIEHLEVWCGADDYGGDCTINDVKPLLERTDLKSLKHLGLKNAVFTDELCELVPASKLMKQLTSLDLSMGCMTDEGAQTLARNKAALAHLASLDVSDNYLTKDGVAALKGVAKSVVATSQRDDEDPEYRSPSVGE